jgi:hypothetical protein
MHIHGNSMNVNAANSYSVANSEKAAATQRAADVRKRLLNSVAGLAGTDSGQAATLVSRWLGANPNQSEGDGEYHASSSGKDSDFG